MWLPKQGVTDSTYMGFERKWLPKVKVSLLMKSKTFVRYMGFDDLYDSTHHNKIDLFKEKIEQF